MTGRGPGGIINFARERELRRKEREDPMSRVARLAEALGETVANAADADHWTTVVGAPSSRGYAFPIASGTLLQTLRSGRRGTHEVTVPLRDGSQEIGSVRLLTVRPEGFSQARLDRARFAAECAGGLLGLALNRAGDDRIRRSRRSDRDHKVVPLHLHANGNWTDRGPSPQAS